MVGPTNIFLQNLSPGTWHVKALARQGNLVIRLSAQGIDTSAQLQHRKSAIHRLIAKSSKSDWLKIQNEFYAHAHNSEPCRDRDPWRRPEGSWTLHLAMEAQWNFDGHEPPRGKKIGSRNWEILSVRGKSTDTATDPRELFMFLRICSVLSGVLKKRLLTTCSSAIFHFLTFQYHGLIYFKISCPFAHACAKKSSKNKPKFHYKELAKLRKWQLHLVVKGNCLE